MPIWLSTFVNVLSSNPFFIYFNKMPPLLYGWIHRIAFHPRLLNLKLVSMLRQEGICRAQWLNLSQLRKEDTRTSCSQRRTVQAIFSVVSKLSISCINPYGFICCSERHKCHQASVNTFNFASSVSFISSPFLRPPSPEHWSEVCVHLSTPLFVFFI